MTRFAYAIIFTALLVGCNPKPSDITSGDGTTKPAPPPLMKLATEDVEPGTGQPAAKGDMVTVLYYGSFPGTTKSFDSNMDPTYKPVIEKPPLSFTIGNGEVIKGWDDGLVGAKDGMVRKIHVPWALAYGADGSSSIPPKSDLDFLVKVLKVTHHGAEPQIDATDIKEGSGAKVTLQSTIKFHYTGSLLNGKVFDVQKSLDLPVSKLIPGFKEAVIGMMVGGERKLIFPPNSPNPTGHIPPNQPFQVDVTIDSVK